MEEYICKNSRRQIPVIVRQFNDCLQWQVKERCTTIKYAEILSVRLNRKGTRCTLTVRATGNRSFELSNRFYFADGTWEDQSHQYATFVRILHFRIKEQPSISFKAGRTPSQMVTGCLLILLAGLAFHIAAGLPGLYISGSVVLAIDGVFILMGLLLILKVRPMPYFANELPIRFLPA